VTEQRLIVLRGNSASGKTTLARELQLAMGRGTANIGQDHFRRVVLREHDVPDADNIKLIAATARHCLAAGYHLIVEGIFVSHHYGPMLRGLLQEHRGPSHVLYFDVPLEETLRRHRARPLAAEVSDEKLREWYVESDLLGAPGELVLEHSQGVAQTLQTLVNTIGPVTPRAEHAGARYL
jgi:predicted kinase